MDLYKNLPATWCFREANGLLNQLECFSNPVKTAAYRSSEVYTIQSGIKLLEKCYQRVMM